jgi:glycine dehydrogenase subunit 2
MNDNINSKIKKATTHVNQNEGLIFEKSSPGKKGYKLAPLDVPAVDAAKLLGDTVRKDAAELPEVSEIEIIRHFTRISTWNYGVDTGLYPLGSCTMKYNARVNEVAVRREGLANAHPYQPEKLSQGALKVLKLLSDCLIEITGMDAITLQPAAGAHGELTGILMVRAYLETQGNPRKKILIPDSAHGTNPATAAIAGYAVENLQSNEKGMVDLAALERQVTDDVAALMLTNPSTIGVYETDIHKIAEILHRKGALLYMDGANMNALCGKTQPGHGHDGGLQDDHDPVGRRRRRRRREVRRGARTADGGGDDHQPPDPRPVRAPDRAPPRGRPRGRCPGLHGRREPHRDPRPVQAG